MFRAFPWLLAVMALFDLLLQSAEGGRAFYRVLELRRSLLFSASHTREAFCLDRASPYSLLWRQDGEWVDACSAEPEAAGRPARYWKVEARLKYRLLFLQQLPITISIVILS